MSIKSSIVLHSLKFQVHLGWPEEERASQQLVSFDIFIDFATPPAACQNDQLDDTFCYQSLSETLSAALSSKSFRLIEHLGAFAYDIIKQSVRSQAEVTLCVTKQPPIANLATASFWYGDNKKW